MYCNKFNPKYVGEFYSVSCKNCIYFDTSINDCIEDDETNSTDKTKEIKK